MGGYFFDEPQTKADFDFWSNVPDWSLDEIVALSLGKDPRFVSSDKFGHGTRGNDFSTAFFERLHKAERAREAGILSDRTPTTQAIKWADAAGFAFPKDVVKKVRRFARLTAMETSITTAPAEPNATDSEIKTELDSLKRSNETRARPAEMENKMHKELVQDPELIDASIDGSVGPRERDSFLKLFVGLGAIHYEYDPSLNRNSCAKKMSTMLGSIGIKLGDDTIRRLLDEGNKYISADAIRAIKAAKAGKT